MRWCYAATPMSSEVGEIKMYSDGYQDPVYRWDEPSVSRSGEDRALVSVQLTMSTADEKTARQDLEFTVDWTTDAHTGAATPVTAEGPGARAFARFQRNTDVHDSILAAMRRDPGR